MQCPIIEYTLYIGMAQKRKWQPVQIYAERALQNSLMTDKLVNNKAHAQRNDNLIKYYRDGR